MDREYLKDVWNSVWEEGLTEQEVQKLYFEKLEKETDEIVGEIFSKVSIEVPKNLVDSMLSMSQSIIETDADDLDDFTDDVGQDLEQLPAPDSDSESETVTSPD